MTPTTTHRRPRPARLATERPVRPAALLGATVLLAGTLAGCTTFDSTLGMGGATGGATGGALAVAPVTAPVGVDTLTTASVGGLALDPQRRASPAPDAAPDLAPNLAPSGGFNYALIYSSTTVDGKALPAVDYERVGFEHLRRDVAWNGPEAPGDIVIDTGGRHLYLVQPGGRAIRYGIAVGREGFGWTGTETLSWKREWPTWTPPESMIEREPELAKWRGGMPGGANNPLGARALYLGDTLYRIHGTDKPLSIGKAASSGCFRMINQDVLDLYERVEPGARVHVRSSVPAEVAFN